jgi:D-beta-D-heptose 7-phosphate kinase/D-beta-D-heptose 1-phosphate adenosyltransferase
LSKIRNEMENHITLLKEAIRKFDSSRLLVAGDIMLDQFVWGDVSRISPEAPVPVVEVQEETMLLGGAANVANNLRALGSPVSLGGVVGKDAMGQNLRELAASMGIDVTSVVDGIRPTTIKTRIIARGQQVVRVDRENNNSLNHSSIKALTKSFEILAPGIDGIIVSDYAKGVVSDIFMAELKKISDKRGIPLLVDPKPAHSHLYYGVTLLTPNRQEAEVMAGLEINDAKSLGQAAQKIQEKMGAKAVLITLGSQGMALWQKENGLFTVPTMAREVFDVTGAGDTVIATMALGIVNGLSFIEAAYLANIAAGIVVGKIGTATVAPEEIMEILEKQRDENDSTKLR